MTIKKKVSKYKMKYVANTSGEILIVPDLRNPVSETGLKLGIDKKVDLSRYFTSRQVNRSQGLDSFAEADSTVNPGKKKLTVFATRQEWEQFKFESKKPLMHTPEGAPGRSYDAPPTYATENLKEIQRKEDEANRRASAFNQDKK